MAKSLTQQIHENLQAQGLMAKEPVATTTSVRFSIPQDKPGAVIHRPDDAGVPFSFSHGLGDAVCLAFAVPLYTKRGHKIQVSCPPDKELLFRAAGAEIVPAANIEHEWTYPPSPPWTAESYLPGNKLWHNVSAWPLPFIGRDPELWREYIDVRLDLDAYVPDTMRAEIESFIADLPRPLVLVHPRGAGPVEMREIPQPTTEALCRKLLDDGGTVLLLDWPALGAKEPQRLDIQHERFKRLSTDWKWLSLPEFYWLLKRANLFIGCDSGPAHFVRFTDTPAIVCWTKQILPFGVPAYCALPRENTVNIVPNRSKQPFAVEFNLETCFGGGDTLSGDFIASVAKRVLAGTEQSPWWKQHNTDRGNVILRFKDVEQLDKHLLAVRNYGVAYQADRSQPIKYDDGYWKEYQQKKSTSMSRRLNIVRRELVYKHAKTVLDVGIGNGSFLEAFNDRSLGYDVNPNAVAWLKERQRFWNPYKTWPKGCDGLTLWDVLEHLPNPSTLLNCVPDGKYVFLSLPIFATLDDVLTSKHYKPDEHFWYFTNAGIRTLMEAHGFQCLESNDAETQAGREGIRSYVFRKQKPVAHAVVQPRKPEPVERLATPADFGGPDKCIQFLIPAGIGDISWVYQKIKCLKSLANREVICYCPGGDTPRRGGDLVKLLPEVHWGGYYGTLQSQDVLMQCVPPDWPEKMGTHQFLCRNSILNLAANLHLESGRKLRDWMPWMPIDYHYEIRVPKEQYDRAGEILSGLNARPLFAIYTSNRDKDNIKAGGWSLWNEHVWADFLIALSKLKCNLGCGFVFVGASYDADKTQAVARLIRAAGLPVRECVNEPLGTAIECLKTANYCFSFPSGMGILPNVLRVPCMMQLPWHLKELAETYADPLDIAENKYRAWPNPKPDEVLEWFEHVSQPMCYANWPTF